MELTPQIYLTGGTKGTMTKRKAENISKELESGSSGSRGEGNTNPLPKVKRCNPAKSWVFTIHGSSDSDIFDWSEEKLHAFKMRLTENCDMCQFQEEEGSSNGRRHLQGFLTFKKKARPMSVFKDIDSTIHWELMKGSIEQNMAYTSKDSTKVPDGIAFSFGLPSVVEKVTWDMLSDENKSFLQPIMDREKDFRTIHWVYDQKGNWGKSKIQKYLVDNHRATMVAGNGKDIAMSLRKYHEEYGYYPEWVVCNIPKSTKEEYISYGMLEQIKDGLLFSGKYKSVCLRIPKVHLVVFANCLPMEGQWSEDRVDLTVIHADIDFNP